MAIKKSGLGRGLDSLLSDNTLTGSDSMTPVQVGIMEVEPNKEQARKVFNDEALSELAASISRHGILQPLLVRPLARGNYQLIAGERRWRAARIAGLTQVPVIIKELTDEEAAVISLIENLQREDLNPIEEAAGYKSLADDYGLSHEQISERVGKSRVSVTNSLRLLNLPKKVIAMVSEGKLSVGHAKVLMSLKEDKQIIEAAQQIIASDWSVRATEKYVKKVNGTEKAKTVKSGKKRDTTYDEVELALFESCGLKAKVEVDKSGNSGILSIEFYSKDQLMSIAKELEKVKYNK